MDDFGRRGNQVLRGKPYGGGIMPSDPQEYNGPRMVSVPYKSPKDRGIEALRRSSTSAGISLAIVVLGLILTFLNQGNFSKSAMIALLVAISSNVIQAAITWLMKYREAKAEEE